MNAPANLVPSRRRFLQAMVAAPAVILTPGLLMPVKKLWTPTTWSVATSGFGIDMGASTSYSVYYWVYYVTTDRGEPDVVISQSENPALPDGWKLTPRLESDTRVLGQSKS